MKQTDVYQYIPDAKIIFGSLNSLFSRFDLPTKTNRTVLFRDWTKA